MSAAAWRRIERRAILAHESDLLRDLQEMAATTPAATAEIRTGPGPHDTVVATQLRLIDDRGGSCRAPEQQPVLAVP